jgi:SAM-dependent methyltransferase
LCAVNDYGPVAHLYDSYVQVDFDLRFFQEEAERVSGPVLELMAGTGRVTAAILERDVRLTCVDISPSMLKVLKRKLKATGRHPHVVCADIRKLPLDCDHELAIIPFNSFSELTEAGDRRQALAEIRRALVQGGRFICTLHNPAVRARTLDGSQRLQGSYPLPEDGGRFELWVEGSLDSHTRRAESAQTYRIFDGEGRLAAELESRVGFALIEKHELEAMVAEAGFEILELYGDYDRSAFHGDSSPFMIWILRKTAQT